VTNWELTQLALHLVISFSYLSLLSYLQTLRFSISLLVKDRGPNEKSRFCLKCTECHSQCTRPKWTWKGMTYWWTTPMKTPCWSMRQHQFRGKVVTKKMQDLAVPHWRDNWGRKCSSWLHSIYEGVWYLKVVFIIFYIHIESFNWWYDNCVLQVHLSLLIVARDITLWLWRKTRIFLTPSCYPWRRPLRTLWPKTCHPRKKLPKIQTRWL